MRRALPPACCPAAPSPTCHRRRGPRGLRPFGFTHALSAPEAASLSPNSPGPWPSRQRPDPAATQRCHCDHFLQQMRANRRHPAVPRTLNNHSPPRVTRPGPPPAHPRRHSSCRASASVALAIRGPAASLARSPLLKRHSPCPTHAALRLQTDVSFQQQLHSFIVATCCRLHQRCAATLRRHVLSATTGPPRYMRQAPPPVSHPGTFCPTCHRRRRHRGLRPIRFARKLSAPKRHPCRRTHPVLGLHVGAPV